MLVKILSSKGAKFPAVQYTTNKVVMGLGELLLLENFPSAYDCRTPASLVRAHFIALGIENTRAKKRQFHMVVSCRFQSEPVDRHLKAAQLIMQQLGYGKQPIVYVEHIDTECRHVHVVSSRIDIHTGKAISNWLEWNRAHRALREFMGVYPNKDVLRLLSYRYENYFQLQTLLFRGGYRLALSRKTPGSLHVVRQESVYKFKISSLSYSKASQEAIQKLQALTMQAAEKYSNKVFVVESDRKERGMVQDSPRLFSRIFESEVQYQLRNQNKVDLILEIDSAGLLTGTVIDHELGEVFSLELAPSIKSSFRITNDTISKKVYLRLQDYKVQSMEEKTLLLDALKDSTIKPFMVFTNERKKTDAVFSEIKKDAQLFCDGAFVNGAEVVLDRNNEFYFLHRRLHFIGELKGLIQIQHYQKFITSAKAEQIRTFHKLCSGLIKTDWTKGELSLKSKNATINTDFGELKYRKW